MGAAAEEVQPEPSLAGDASGGASREDLPELETKDKVGAGEIEEQEDLFALGSKDRGGDGGAKGKADVPANTADQQDDIFSFSNEE